MDKLLPWAAGLPFVPKVILSLVVVSLAVFVLFVLWTPSSTTDTASRVSPQENKEPVKSDAPQLSRAECDALADLLRRGRAGLNRLVAERASETARAEVTGIQNEIRDWLGHHLSSVYAEAFMSAEPSTQVPDRYPFQYAGLYQQMRGRLTYLTTIVGRFCG